MGYGIIILLSVVSAAIMAVMISALGEELFLRLTILGFIGFSLYHLCTAEKKIMQQPIESSTKKRNSNNTAALITPQNSGTNATVQGSIRDCSSKPEPILVDDNQIYVKNEQVEIIRFTTEEKSTGQQTDSGTQKENCNNTAVPATPQNNISNATISEFAQVGDDEISVKNNQVELVRFAGVAVDTKEIDVLSKTLSDDKKENSVRMEKAKEKQKAFENRQKELTRVHSCLKQTYETKFKELFNVYSCLNQIYDKHEGLPKLICIGDYRVLEKNGVLTIKKFIGNERAVVHIPGILNGKPVRVIDTYAFCNHQHIEKIVIEEGVTDIRKGAFKDCFKLKEIVLPSTLKVLGQEVMTGLENIRKAVFEHCALESIVIPDSVEIIGDGAFYNNVSLSLVYMSDSVKYLGRHAFSGTALREIHLSSNLTKIEDGTFEHTKLYSIELPDSVKSIGERAFYNCKHIKTVKLPDSLEEIGEAAFRGCTQLEELILPKTLTHIGANVFKVIEGYGKTNLNTIFYCDVASPSWKYAFENQLNRRDVAKREQHKEVEGKIPKNKPLKVKEETKASEEKAKQPFSMTLEYDIDQTSYGRVIRHSKYNIIFQMDYKDKDKAEMEGKLIVWENDNRMCWPLKNILGCEYIKNNRRSAHCGQLTKQSKNRTIAMGSIPRPKNGLVLHLKGEVPYAILDFVRSSENLEKTYETMDYLLGDKTGRCPFRRMSKK